MAKIKKHATVKIGEYIIPLIGIDPAATEETCDNCGLTAHITQFVISRGSGIVCRNDKECLKRKECNDSIWNG